MRILFLNQAPKAGGNKEKAHYESGAVEKMLNGYASPGTRIELGFPDNFAGSQVMEAVGSQKMLNGLHHMMETPAIVRKIVWAAENGYDAVIQSNTFDPGVEGGRLAVGIPVIGLLRTALHTAAMLADRIGITVPLASHVPYTRRIIRSYGMAHAVSGMLPVGVYGKDIPSRRQEIFDITVGLIRRLVEETGAEIILPLGGALIPYVVDPKDLERAAGVPVLNTKAIGIRFAEICVAQGLTQSPLTYPRARLRYEDFSSKM